MLAVKGYYDGKQIVVNEMDLHNFNIGDEVIITILDSKIITKKETKEEKRRRIIDLDTYVKPTGRTVEEIDSYIRELRENDRL